MEIITKEELMVDKEEYIKRIKQGAVFIHPTDTIYGLGCDATNTRAVTRIRHIKRRQDAPFSVIVPSKNWIYDNCEVPQKAFKWIERLPGPYTLILKLINNKAVSPKTNAGMETLGVRIPDHWFSRFVARIGVPIVTTSANISGGDFMTSIDDMDSAIGRKVDFIIYEGEKRGRPSTLVNLVEEKITITKR